MREGRKLGEIRDTLPEMDVTAAVRQVVVAILRLSGIGLLVFAALTLPSVLTVLLGVWRGAGSRSDLWERFIDLEGPSYLIRLALLLIGGGLLLAFSGRLTLWLVPRVTTKCLRCGHRLDDSNKGVCPECGAEV